MGQCLCSTDREDRYPNGLQPAQDDELSCCSDSSNSEYMNLAYQRTGDYPELMDELENTLSYRNRLRVQKTMQRFEMLSRQNKNLEKPIFEDEESMHYVPGRRHKHHDHSECKCANCEERPRRQQYPTRNESLGKRANYQPTPFPRNNGYVEQVARYMDPNLNFQRRNNHNGRKSNGRGSNGQDLSTVTNSTGTWQMDPRKGEWVKVHPNAHNNGSGQNQYDFENNYPPLPPRPGSNNMYERRAYGHERGHCACTKCARRQR